MAFHAEICLLAVFPARIWTHTGHLPVNHNTKQTLVMLIITIINKRKTKKKKKIPILMKHLSNSKLQSQLFTDIFK